MIELSKNPEVLTILGIISAPVNTFFAYYFLFTLRLGWLGMVLIPFPMECFSLVIKWIFMKKKIVDIDWKFWKGCAWQVFGAPLIAGFFYVFFILFILQVFWPLISAPFFAWQILYKMDWLLFIPVFITLGLLLAGVMLIYMPLYGFVGGFDEHTLNDFKKSVALSGPSIWLIYPFYKIMKHFHHKAPEWARQRAPIEGTEDALKELDELSLIRYEARKKIEEEKKANQGFIKD
jgi:hypothetical protein